MPSDIRDRRSGNKPAITVIEGDKDKISTAEKEGNLAIGLLLHLAIKISTMDGKETIAITRGSGVDHPTQKEVEVFIHALAGLSKASKHFIDVLQKYRDTPPKLTVSVAIPDADESVEFVGED